MVRIFDSGMGVLEQAIEFTAVIEVLAIAFDEAI
jgi:hypothetical protein